MKPYQIIFVFLLIPLHLSLSFSYQVDENPVEVIRLSEKVIVLTGIPLPSGCQVIAISTQKGIVVVDSMGSYSVAQEIRQIIEKEFKKGDFAYLIITHDHPDHTIGNQAFTDAVIIGHELCREIMQNRKRLWTKEFILSLPVIQRLKGQVGQFRTRLKELDPDDAQVEILHKQIWSAERQLADIEAISDIEQDKIVTPPTLSFTDRMTLDLKDMIIHLYYFGNYHSDNDIFIHVPEEEILIIGDTFSKSFLPGTSSNVRKVKVALWLEVLDAILAEPDELKHAVGGHTDIFSREEIAASRDYMRELWEGICTANAEGLDLEAIQRRFPLSNFSYITKTKNQDETVLQRQHQIIVQGFWRQHQNKEFVFEKIMQTAQEIDLNTLAGAKAVLDKYREMVSNQNEYFFHEAVINNNANNFIQMNFLDEAVELLRLHIKVFPESSAAYAILGDAYTAKGEIELAVKSLRKSLKLVPENKSVKEKLKKLEKIK